MAWSGHTITTIVLQSSKRCWSMAWPINSGQQKHKIIQIVLKILRPSAECNRNFPKDYRLFIQNIIVKRKWGQKLCLFFIKLEKILLFNCLNIVHKFKDTLL